MVLPGHIAAGYITAFTLVTTLGYSFTPSEYTLLLTAGALLGDAPDADVIFSFFKKKSTDVSSLKGHRDHITHIPLLWLILGLSVCIIGTASSSDVIRTIGLLLWLCPWSHLLCDSILTDTGVRWLAPFNQKHFMILKKEPSAFPSNWKNLFVNYAKNPLCYLELSLVILAVIIFFYS